ncbi:MAG: hypothetical protein GC193_06380 [Cryomorphaceae bacterium]|nr:hypothetical protein [Cryomorphaceae bacterium]
MQLEEIIQYLIIVHAFFGGLGLISGLGSVLTQKGSTTHKRFGIAFTVSMLISCVLSLVVASMPNHVNSLLLLLGVFTIYMVITGNRALRYKPHLKDKASVVDYLISAVMLAWSIFMVIRGITTFFNENVIDILPLVFGSIGMSLSRQDFKFYKTFQTSKKAWLTKHITKMMGAFIASITAFIVAGIGIHSIIAWLLPSVIGSLYITYSISKVKKLGKQPA